MKRLSTIIATLCVAAIGVSMFFACEKEPINEPTLNSNMEKIQKYIDESNFRHTFFSYIDDPETFYWLDPNCIEPLPMVYSLVHGPKNLHGARDESSYAGWSCQSSGNDCGTLREKNDQGKVIAYGYCWKCEQNNKIYHYLCYRE